MRRLADAGWCHSQQRHPLTMAQRSRKRQGCGQPTTVRKHCRLSAMWRGSWRRRRRPSPSSRWPRSKPGTASPSPSRCVVLVVSFHSGEEIDLQISNDRTFSAGVGWQNEHGDGRVRRMPISTRCGGQGRSRPDLEITVCGVSELGTCPRSPQPPSASTGCWPRSKRRTTATAGDPALRPSPAAARRRTAQGNPTRR
jgi:hypothetical protein